MANRQLYQLTTKTLSTTDVLATQVSSGVVEAGKNTVQDILNLVPTPTAGPGITVNGLEITASVRSVNGIYPVDGNIQSTLTATRTGLSSSLILSASGDVTSSLEDGLIWIVAGETGSISGSNGKVYIYASGSVGAWYAVAPTDQASNDARYLMLTPQSPLAGTLDLGSQDVTNGGIITATSFAGTASWANNATTALTSSYVNPLVQNVSVVGKLAVSDLTVWTTGSLTVSSFVSKTTVPTSPIAILTSNETGAGSVYPTQLTFNQLGAVDGWSIQSTNQGIGYTPLALNPIGGQVTIPTASVAVLEATGSLFGTASYALNSGGGAAPFPYTGSAQITGSLAVNGPVALTNLLQGDNGTTIQNITAGNLTVGSSALSGSFADRILPLGYTSYNIWFNESSGGNNYLRITTTAGGETSYTGPITIAAQQGSSPTTIRYANAFGGVSTITTISENEWVTLRGQGTVWEVLTRGRVNETLISKGATGAVQSITGSLIVTGSFLSRDGVSLGTNISNQHFITGSVKVSGSIQMSATSSFILPTTATTAPATGQVYFDFTVNKLYAYNGSAWVTASLG